MISKKKYLTFILFAIILILCNFQPIDVAKVHIQSRKFLAISQQSQIKLTPQKINYTVPYARKFIRKPDIGLSIYNIQFDYNPEFSINVIEQTSTNANFKFYLTGRPSDSNIANQLSIMYIASDYDYFGIYMPGQIDTTAKLGIPSFVANRSEEFTFNFKSINFQPIFPATANQQNIKVSVYLTGIVAFSQTIQIGYSKNYAYFSILVSKKNTRFYTIQVNVRSTSGDVLIKKIQFTVIYFDIIKLAEFYQANSNIVDVSNFGGTFFKSSLSASLDPLVQNNKYENSLQYFFGLSQIQCSEGQTINLLAVQRFNYNSNGKLQNLLITFQTQRNTYIRRAVYQYIQYKPKTCNDSAYCGIPCNNPNQPSYNISNTQNLCAPCNYFCSACENAFNCTQCPSTRAISTGAICVCRNKTQYDDQSSSQCLSCFDTNFCQTCIRKGVCQTCHTKYNFTFNNVLRTCQCSPGTYNTTNIVRNIANFLKQIAFICQACPDNCIYCGNKTQCEACTVPTYLSPNPKQISGQISTCTPICKSTQVFNSLLRKCQPYRGDLSLFDTNGRLSFDWDYKNINNQLIVNLLFSQINMSYYFYQNGLGYQYVNTANEQIQRNNDGEANIFYDDGNGYINGYNQGRQVAQKYFANTKLTQESSYMFDQSALRGQYYGLGQAKFFRDKYKELQPQPKYFDQFGIPAGKHRLRSNQLLNSVTFIDAIRDNLQFIINNQSLPYSIRAMSGNHFQLIITPQKSVLSTKAQIVFKNPALVRSGQTALQTPVSSKQLDRLDYYTQSQLLTASTLRDRTITLIQILWGICKYGLFIGFGWTFMPLMLIMQYIFGHNYINSQLPLNLQYFLTSFADFRNPSVLYNPLRNQFDAKVVSHPQIYKTVSSFNQFDRGIDFMKNSFQLFFVPLLSFALQFALIGINYLINIFCNRDVPLISHFLRPRLGLHAAAYTLVQALPISFFFFGQLQDTRYNHPLSPNSYYPSFNTGISYASFFASAIIPIMLLTWIYNYFKNKARTGTLQLAKLKANQNLQQKSKDPAMLGDPLWGADPLKTQSYGFGASVFYLPLLIGFFLSFFTNTYPWQLTGLLLSNLAFTSYAAATSNFISKIPKYFLIVTGALMIAYELVHAGVGSNRSLSTYDQLYTGYLGIGILYALILVGILFCGYLLYKLFQNLYKSFLNPYGCFPRLQKLKQNQTNINQQIIDDKQQRDQALGRKNLRQTNKMRSYIDMNPPSEDRLLVGNKQTGNILNATKFVDNSQLYTQNLLYIGTGPAGKSRFRGEQSGREFAFPAWSTAILMRNSPLLIDSQQKIYTKNKKYFGPASYFLQQKPKSQSSQDLIYHTRKNINTNRIQQLTQLNKQTSNNLNNAYQMIVNNNPSYKVINIGSQQYHYKSDQSDQDFIIVNYNGQKQYKLNTDQMASLFIQNNNKINYEGEDYYLRREIKLNDDQEEEQTFYLVNPNSMQNIFSLSKQNLHSLLKTKRQAAGNLASTSMLRSNKNINSNQFIAFHPAITNKSIVFTKDTQQYLIGGQVYQKIGQNQQKIFFKNKNTKQQISVNKEQIIIKQKKVKQKYQSYKQIIDNKLYNDQNMIRYQGQRYLYLGNQNNRYTFQNVNNKSKIYLTIQQLLQLYGIESNNKYNVNNKVNINYVPPGSIQLKLVGKSSDLSSYVYENRQTGQNLQIPVEWIDASYNVYVDKQMRCWHKGQILNEQNNISQSNIQAPISKTANQVPYTNKIISSKSSLQSISDAINKDDLYNIKFLSPSYIPQDNKLPSNTDVEQIKQNVIENMKKINPYTQVYIESITNPSQKFIIS